MKKENSYLLMIGRRADAGRILDRIWTVKANITKVLNDKGQYGMTLIKRRWDHLALREATVFISVFMLI